MCHIILWADFPTTLETVLIQHILSDEIKDFLHGTHFSTVEMSSTVASRITELQEQQRIASMYVVTCIHWVQ